jgi:hypothetical protein
MMKASECFKKGEFNTANFEWKGDVVTVLIHKHNWKRSYRFKARNLNCENEEILDDETVEEVVK